MCPWWDHSAGRCGNKRRRRRAGCIGRVRWCWSRRGRPWQLQRPDGQPAKTHLDVKSGFMKHRQSPMSQTMPSFRATTGNETVFPWVLDMTASASLAQVATSCRFGIGLDIGMLGAAYALSSDTCCALIGLLGQEVADVGSPGPGDPQAGWRRPCQTPRRQKACLGLQLHSCCQAPGARLLGLFHPLARAWQAAHGSREASLPAPGPQEAAHVLGDSWLLAASRAWQVVLTLHIRTLLGAVLVQPLQPH